jgi:hypothetical protein
VNPQTREANQIYYEVTIDLRRNTKRAAGFEQSATNQLRYGQTGVVWFEGQTEPIGAAITRRMMRSWDKLREG